MDIQNHYYGHSAVLARVSGLEKPRHVRGLIQHGWTVSHPVTTQFGDFAEWDATRRRLVWTSSSRGWSMEDPASFDEAGRRIVDAIGAPFLYLYKHALETGTLPPRDGRTLVLPLHGTALLQVYGDHGTYARQVLEEEGPSRVSLHVEDFDNEGIMDAWRSAGHEIVSAGERRDPQFINRIVHMMATAPRVTSNRLSTAIMYAAAAGAEVAITGPEFQLGDNPDADPGQQMRKIWPEFHDKSADQSLLKKLAEDELGLADMKSPEELRHLTGWDHSTFRPAWDYWASGPLHKAQTVLGLRKVPEGAHATEQGLSAWHWIRHPLKHLPSPLAALPELKPVPPLTH